MTVTPTKYSYKAKIIRFVDGDTVWLEVDLGFRMTTINDFRLYGVNTPERGQAGYTEAKHYCEDAAPAGTEVLIYTYKDPDKYGRWLADLVLSTGALLSEELIDAGLGVWYLGGKK